MSTSPSGHYLVMPKSEQAETALLASILINPQSLTRVKDMLPAGDKSFYVQKHQLIYQAVLDLEEQGFSLDLNDLDGNEEGSTIAIDLPLLASRLIEKNQLEAAGGVNYLAGLMESEATSAYAELYARQVAAFFARRELIETAQKIIQSALQSDKPPQDLLSEAEGQMVALSNSLLKSSGALSPMEMSVMAEKVVQMRSEREAGEKFGIAPLDALLGSGARPGELISIGMKPSFGKSALLMAMCRGYAYTNDKPAAFIAGEQNQEELVVRLLAARAHESANSLNPTLLGSQSFKDKMLYEAGNLAMDGVHLFTPRPFTLQAVLRASREAVVRHGCGVVAWDYGQIIDAGTNDTRRDVLQVTRKAKQFAQEHNVIVLLAGQLLQTSLGRPKREHFKESKSFSEDSDICLLGHRPDIDFVEEDKETFGCNGIEGVTPGTTLLISDKNRRGTWGAKVTTTLQFISSQFRYKEEFTG